MLLNLEFAWFACAVANTVSMAYLDATVPKDHPHVEWPLKVLKYTAGIALGPVWTFAILLAILLAIMSTWNRD